ncbi:molybdate ABC transporter substrate-binding protein [Inmirania thermothiophila]|uniref:Molybdate transport system substrate-binding protein n=1 Tax=Inmirania thermothiophila TaxID=1750597 RepID=A0A3N1Y0D7_9GAMM|nr:molybdate ABC transporter substrate-binding protein [Inmirania thermothiophila]ROR31981.1 molybdate transport system substrate-binding protein [Inmirania thermothiophila]
MARLLLWATLLLWAGAAPAGEVRLAAAADLTYALGEILPRFEVASGHHVRLSLGSSGRFARQILRGAPFELYMSADEGYVRRLAEAGRTEGEGALYAEGRIVLFVPEGSRIGEVSSLEGLGAAARDGRLRRLAIANPAHAPYGRAAAEALRAAGVWAAVEPLLVLGDNAAQATRFAVEGGADAGIIPLSMARAPALAGRGRWRLVPARLHRPLRQRMVLIRGAGAAARALYAYLQGAEARAVLARYGFLLPGG